MTQKASAVDGTNVKVRVVEDEFDYVKAKTDVYYHRARHQLSKDSGVPLNTINKILLNITPNPQYHTVRKLYLAIKAKEIAIRQKEEEIAADRAKGVIVL